jgi:hypothetical protein
MIEDVYFKTNGTGSGGVFYFYGVNYGCGQGMGGGFGNGKGGPDHVICSTDRIGVGSLMI